MSQNDVLGRLAANIKARRTARPEDSHTRRLLDGAPVKPAKKLGEEAVEAAIAAIAQDDAALIAEAADQLLQPTQAEALRRLPKNMAESLKVCAATLGDDGGPLGAARAAMIAR